MVPINWQDLSKPALELCTGITVHPVSHVLSDHDSYCKLPLTLSLTLKLTLLGNLSRSIHTCTKYNLGHKNQVKLHCYRNITKNMMNHCLMMGYWYWHSGLLTDG